MVPKRIVEVIHAFGHPNILASHPTTIMITKERQVTQEGRLYSGGRCGQVSG